MLIGFERHIVAFKRHYFVYGLSHDKDIFALDIFVFLCLKALWLESTVVSPTTKIISPTF